MPKKIFMVALSAAILAGCQAKNVKKDGVSQEQDQALVNGRAMALYSRLDEVCPLTETDEKNFRFVIATTDLFYSNSPFESYFLHGKRSTLTESRKQLTQRLKAVSSDHLTACDMVKKEVNQTATRLRKVNKKIKKLENSVLGQIDYSEPEGFDYDFNKIEQGSTEYSLGVVAGIMQRLDNACTFDEELSNAASKSISELVADNAGNDDFEAGENEILQLTDEQIESLLKHRTKSASVNEACNVFSNIINQAR